MGDVACRGETRRRPNVSRANDKHAHTRRGFRRRLNPRSVAPSRRQRLPIRVWFSPRCSYWEPGAGRGHSGGPYTPPYASAQSALYDATVTPHVRLPRCLPIANHCLSADDACAARNLAARGSHSSKSFVINRAQAASSGGASDRKRTALPMNPLMRQIVRRLGGQLSGSNEEILILPGRRCCCRETEI